VCRIVSTARLSADAPHELALISAARPCRVRIPRLLILEDMSFPPFSRLIAAIFDEDWRARHANHDRPCLACYKTALASIIEFSSCVLAPRQRSAALLLFCY
jgi:hypothetical protein